MSPVSTSSPQSRRGEAWEGTYIAKHILMLGRTEDVDRDRHMFTAYL